MASTGPPAPAPSRSRTWRHRTRTPRRSPSTTSAGRQDTVTLADSIPLELGDIQSGALYERPSPYVGTYLLLRIDDRTAGRELVRRLHGLMEAARASTDPPGGSSLTVAFTYHGLEALGVPQTSLDSFSPEFQAGMA